MFVGLINSAIFHSRRSILAGAVVFAFLGAAVSAVVGAEDEGEKLIQSVFGQRIKQAIATSSHEDDVTLAKELLASAEQANGAPKLIAAFCEKAYDLARRHDEGHDTAIDAMHFWMQHDVTQRDVARERLLTLYTLQTRRGDAGSRSQAARDSVDLLLAMGDEQAAKRQWPQASSLYRRALMFAARYKLGEADEVRAKVTGVASLQRTYKKIEQLDQQMLKDASNADAAEAIVLLYVKELDRPSEAKRYVSRLKDAALRKHVEIAGRELSGLNASESFAVGQWYDQLALGETGTQKNALMIRARDYLSRFLLLHTATDLSRKKAELLLARIDSTLKKSGGSSSSSPDAPPALKLGIKVMDVTAFETEYAKFFPLSKNRTAGGVASSSGNHSHGGSPDAALQGRRRGKGWCLSTRKAGFWQCDWKTSISTRYVLLFSRNRSGGTKGADKWGNAVVKINGAKVAETSEVANGKMLFIDLGRTVRLRQLRIELNDGTAIPGLAGAELYGG